MKENEFTKLIEEMVMKECGCNDVSYNDVIVGEPTSMGMTAPAVQSVQPFAFEDEPNEGYMVMQNLHKIHEYSGKLMSMLDESMDMPEWVEDKVATCSDRISSVFHYLEYKMNKE